MNLYILKLKHNIRVQNALLITIFLMAVTYNTVLIKVKTIFLMAVTYNTVLIKVKVVVNYSDH